MSRSEERITVEFGCLAPPLYKQLDKPEKSLRLIQKMANAICLLSVQGILPTSEVEKSRMRLLNRIAEMINKQNPHVL